MTEEEIIHSKVLKYFKGDKHKTNLWFSTPNLLLGFVTPNHMIKRGLVGKLKKFIGEAKEYNNVFNEEFMEDSPVGMFNSASEGDLLDIPAFKKFDMVIKDRGDYTFSGTVIAVMEKVQFYDDGDFDAGTGILRYAVQNNAGLIHILNESQIRLDGEY